MKRLLLITAFILASAGTIYDSVEDQRAPADKNDTMPDDSPIQKDRVRSVFREPYMDGVVTGKGMEIAKDGTRDVIYLIYIKTNKGLLKKFHTTENNYNTLQKGYSVHYVLTGAGKYKMVEYRAPE